MCNFVQLNRLLNKSVLKINLISPMTIEESQILQPRNWVDLTCSAIRTIPFQLSPSNPHFFHCFCLFKLYN